MTRFRKLVQGACATVAFLVGGQAFAQVPAEPIKIGLLTTFSSGQLGGKTIVEATQMAIDDFGGKVLGRPIELLTGDYQLKPDVASLIARRWIDQDKIAAIVPNTISPAAFAVLELARQHDVPVLLAGPGSEDLTGKSCTPVSIQFVWDTYSLSRAVVNGLVAKGMKSWFIISVDNAFGQSIDKNMTEFVNAAGGKVVGIAHHPLGMTDFSSPILTAQASKADVIALGTTSDDLVNLIKQSGEFGVTKGGQHIAVLSMNIQDVHSVGLQAAQGLEMVTPFYGSRDDATAAWTKRYTARPNTWNPTLIEAGAYSATLHYLKAVQAAGTIDGKTVMAKMKSMPIDDFEMQDVPIRADGQAMRPMYLVRVKSPAESKFPFDYYALESVVAPQDAWRSTAESACPVLRAAQL